MHYLLNIVYWSAVVVVVRDTARPPSEVFALICGVVMSEVAIAIFTNLLSEGLGAVAWVGIFGGSLIALVISVVLLVRTHPLAKRLHLSETET